MFLVMPRLLERGWPYWASLGVCVLVTFGCFALTALAARRFGVHLFS